MRQAPVFTDVSKPALIEKAAFCETSNFQSCVRCVMDNTDPLIEFDDEGLCNHCKYFDGPITEAWKQFSLENYDLEKVKEKIKSNTNEKGYDSILGISGGVDSCYTAYIAKEWGLNPLVYHVDAGWNSPEAVRNIFEICDRLGFDLFVDVVDWDYVSSLQVAFLKSGVANQDIPQDHLFFSSLFKFAGKHGIKTVLSGSNFATENTLPQAWGYDAMDPEHIKDVVKKNSRMRLKKNRLLTVYDRLVKIPLIQKMEIVTPLNFVEYNKSKAKQLLIKDLGWRDYGGKHFESAWTRFFQSYLLPHRWGYDKRKAHLSSLINVGHITRESAVKELKQPLCDQLTMKRLKKLVCQKLGIEEVEMDGFIVHDLVSFDEYKTHHKLLNFASRIKQFLRW